MNAKVGDYVWMTFAETRAVKHECPICAATCKVTLILGNGDRMILPCDYCGKGYEGPRGYIEEHEYVSGAEQRRISKVTVTENMDGTETEYLLEGDYVGREDTIFATRDEAVAESERRNAEQVEAERTRAEYIKKDHAKSYAWNAGYHLREAKKNEKSAAYHREKALLCKSVQGAPGKTHGGVSNTTYYGAVTGSPWFSPSDE